MYLTCCWGFQECVGNSVLPSVRLPAACKKFFKKQLRPNSSFAINAEVDHDCFPLPTSCWEPYRRLHRTPQEQESFIVKVPSFFEAVQS